MTTITIPGEPVAKGRPRFTARSGVPRTYTPRKTQEAEERIGWELKAVCPQVDSESEFAVELVFWTKKRVDLDNLVKLVLDAANGVIWADDSQVGEIKALRWSEPVTSPATQISWWEK